MERRATELLLDGYQEHVFFFMNWWFYSGSARTILLLPASAIAHFLRRYHTLAVDCKRFANLILSYVLH